MALETALWLVLASEGEGVLGEATENAELRGSWRRAIDPWFKLKLGVRHDFQPGAQRSYAFVGITGLAPYWFETGAYAFVSDQGDAHVRLEAEYDQRITQKLILQPAIELDAALQDVPELGIGSALGKLELSLRLRYEIRREFGTYFGLHWERRLGATADYAGSADKNASTLAALFGIRAWF